MRGRAKRLRPILTDSVGALLAELDDAAAGALMRWYLAAYDAATDALEAADGEDAEFGAVSEAVRGAELPPAPPALDTDAGRLAVGVVRATALALILGDFRKSLAGRALKRAARLRAMAQDADGIQAAASEQADGLRALAAEEERAAEDDEGAAACPRCPTDNADNADSTDERGRSSPPSQPPSSKPKTSKKEAINARARASATARSSSAWIGPHNLDGSDPVDLALDITGEPREDARARACWGYHLRRLGARRFCEALHAFDIDSQTGRLHNRAAALNVYLGGLRS